MLPSNPGPLSVETIVVVELVPRGEAGFLKFKRQFHVSDCVGCHHQFIAIKPGQQMLWDVSVPCCPLLRVGEVLPLPLGGESAVNDLDDFDQEGSAVSRPYVMLCA